MRNTIFLVPVLLAFTFILSSCGPRAFTKGGYDDPNKVILLDDKFGTNDMQVIANALVDSLGKYSGVQNQPVVMVGKVKNRTSEHVDVKSLTDKIRVALQKAGKYSFIDKDARDEIAEEYEYQGGKFTDQKTA